MEGKRKRKNYFSSQGNEQKRRKRLSLECGMRGFLCTCNFREKDCVREAYNLLNEYADKIYDSEAKQITDNETLSNKNGKNKEKEEKPVENEEEKTIEKEEENKVEKEEEKVVEKDDECKDKKEDKEEQEKSEDKSEEKQDVKEESGDESEDESEEEEEDISTALNKEIDELKTEAGKPLSQKKFQVVDTGVNNVIFIKSTVPDTLELLTAIVKDLHETKKQKTRYLLRMLPIQVTCKAYIDDIRSKADALFEKYFAQEPKTFSIVFNRHSNKNLHRNEVIEDLAQIIAKKNPGNKANLKNPDIAVVVEVVRAVCLISIAPNYFMYKKYNLLEICNQK